MAIRRMRVQAGALVCVVGLVLTGCSGGGSGDPDPNAPSPLAEFFGWDERAERVGSPEFSEEERQQHHQVEALVQACMEEAGFDYFPEPFWGDRTDAGFEDPYEEVWQLQQDDPEAFAKQYGYGATTIQFDQVEPEPTEAPSPNEEYRASLPESAQAEYDRTLWGEGFDETEVIDDDGVIVDEVQPTPAEPSGCYAEASQEVYGWEEDPEGDTDRFQGIWEEMEALEERISNDPRLAEALEAWSGCMSAAGYPGLVERWDAENEVWQRMDQLYGWDDPTIEETGEGGGAGQPTPEPTEVPEPDPEALAELQEFELAIAWADFTCQQEHELDEVERQVRFELETQFIEDHREDLEALREWENERGFGG